MLDEAPVPTGHGRTTPVGSTPLIGGTLIGMHDEGGAPLVVPVLAESVVVLVGTLLPVLTVVAELLVLDVLAVVLVLAELLVLAILLVLLALAVLLVLGVLLVLAVVTTVPDPGVVVTGSCLVGAEAVGVVMIGAVTEMMDDPLLGLDGRLGCVVMGGGLSCRDVALPMLMVVPAPGTVLAGIGVVETDPSVEPMLFVVREVPDTRIVACGVARTVGVAAPSELGRVVSTVTTVNCRVDPSGWVTSATS